MHDKANFIIEYVNHNSEINFDFVIVNICILIKVWK